MCTCRPPTDAIDPGSSAEGSKLSCYADSNNEEPWATLWRQAHEEAKAGKREITEDGYYFVACPDCAGTGKAPDVKEGS